MADIRDAFGLSNVGSVSFITTQIRKRINENPDFAKTIQRINAYVIKKATCPLNSFGASRNGSQCTGMAVE